MCMKFKEAGRAAGYRTELITVEVGSRGMLGVVTVYALLDDSKHYSPHLFVFSEDVHQHLLQFVSEFQRHQTTNYM